MKNALYFQHDYNARNDVRLLEIRAEFGAEGYGLFWMMIETFFEDNGIINRGAIGGLCLGYGTTKGVLMPIIDFCIEIGLFIEDDDNKDIIFNQRVNDQLEFRKQLSIKGLEGAKKRWDKNKNRGGNGGANAKDKDKVKVKDKVRDIKKSKPKKELSKDEIKLNELLKHEYLNNAKFSELWIEFSELKKGKGAINAKKRALMKLFRYDIKVCIVSLENSLQSGWPGVFPESVKLETSNQKGEYRTAIQKQADVIAKIRKENGFASGKTDENIRDVEINNELYLEG